MLNFQATSIIRILVAIFTIIATFGGCSYNTKLTGILWMNENNRECTKVDCNCCNSCIVRLFLIAQSDTILLLGANGQEAVCRGKECETLNCEPWQIGKTYKMKGHYISSASKNKNKIFEFEDYKILTIDNK